MNKDLLIKGMIFLAGGAIGSVVTWKLVKTKYEQLANEEIESVREYYNKKKGTLSKDENQEAGKKLVEDAKEENENPDELSIQEIRERVQELGYINDRVMEEKKNKKEDEKSMDKPYVIAPEESWEQDYPTLTLTYYEGDGVLANDRNEIIENIDELVGEDFADHFGEYEDDSVYIRNDGMQVYYEILRDYGKYSEN